MSQPELTTNPLTAAESFAFGRLWAVWPGALNLHSELTGCAYRPNIDLVRAETIADVLRVASAACEYIARVLPDGRDHVRQIQDIAADALARGDHLALRGVVGIAEQLAAELPSTDCQQFKAGLALLGDRGWVTARGEWFALTPRAIEDATVLLAEVMRSPQQAKS